MNVLSCGPKASNISGIADAFSPRNIRKNPRGMYVRVPQICSKNRKIVPYPGDSPNTRNGARAYDLRPLGNLSKASWKTPAIPQNLDFRYFC